MISLYKNEAIRENKKTHQSSLARFIHEKELLKYPAKGEFRPLKLSTIKEYVSELWEQVKIENTGKRKGRIK